MKKLILFTSAVLLTSCSSQPSLCDCVDAGDAVNKISATFFDRRPTKESMDSLKQAEKTRDSMCAPYKTMMPEELQKKAADCKSLQFSPED